jgi:hypothetical protein
MPLGITALQVPSTINGTKKRVNDRVNRYGSETGITINWNVGPNEGTVW